MGKNNFLIVLIFIIILINYSTSQTVSYYIDNTIPTINNGNGMITNPYSEISSVFTNNLTNLSSEQIINIYLFNSTLPYIFPTIIPIISVNIMFNVQDINTNNNFTLCESLPQLIFEDATYQTFVNAFTFTGLNLIYNVSLQSTQCVFGGITNSNYGISSSCLNIEIMDYASLFCNEAGLLSIENTQITFPSDSSINNLITNQLFVFDIQTSITMNDIDILCFDAIALINIQNASNIIITNSNFNCFSYNQINNVSSIVFENITNQYSYQATEQSIYYMLYSFNVTNVTNVLFNNITVENSDINKLSMLNLVNITQSIILTNLNFMGNLFSDFQIPCHPITIQSSLNSIYGILNISNISYTNNNIALNVAQSSIYNQIWLIFIQDFFEYSTLSEQTLIPNTINYIMYSSNNFTLSIFNYTSLSPSPNFTVNDGTWILNNITIQNTSIISIQTLENQLNFISTSSNAIWNITSLTIMNIECISNSTIGSINTTIIYLISFLYQEEVNFDTILIQNNSIYGYSIIIILTNGELQLNQALINENYFNNTIVFHYGYTLGYVYQNINLTNNYLMSSIFINLDVNLYTNLPEGDYSYSFEYLIVDNITLVNESLLFALGPFGCYSISKSLFTLINISNSQLILINDNSYQNQLPTCNLWNVLDQSLNLNFNEIQESLIAIYSNTFDNIISQNSQLFSFQFTFNNYFTVLIINNSMSNTTLQTTNDYIITMNKVDWIIILNNMTDFQGQGQIIYIQKSELWYLFNNSFTNSTGVSYLSMYDAIGGNSMSFNYFANLITNINQRFISIEYDITSTNLIFEQNTFFNITALNQLLMFEISANTIIISGCSFIKINAQFFQLMTFLTSNVTINNSVFIDFEGSNSKEYIYLLSEAGIYIESSTFLNLQLVATPFFFMVGINFDNNSTVSNFYANNITVLNHFLLFASASLSCLNFYIGQSNFTFTGNSQITRLISGVIDFSNCGISQALITNVSIYLSDQWNISGIDFIQLTNIQSFNLVGLNMNGDVYNNTSQILVSNIIISSQSDEGMMFIQATQVPFTTIEIINMTINGLGLALLNTDSGNFILSNLTVDNVQNNISIIDLLCNVFYQASGQSSFMSITNSNFQNILFQYPNENIGTIYISDDGTSSLCNINLNITNSTFVNISVDSTIYNSSAITLQYDGISNIIIKNSSFLECSSNSGPSMIILQGNNLTSQFTNVTVIDSNFTNNFAQQEGGAIYTTQNSLTLQNCSFSNNVAYSGAGGAIFVNSPLCGQLTQSIILNNTFINNSGYAYSNIYENKYSVSSLPIDFLVTASFYGDRVSNYYYYNGMVIDNNLLSITNASTYALSFLLWNFTLLDSLNNPMILSSSQQQQIIVQLTAENKTFVSQNCNNVSCLITGANNDIYGSFYQTIPITLNYIVPGLSLPTQTFSLTFRPCMIGEILLNTPGYGYECYFCENQTYSVNLDFEDLNTNIQCSPCPIPYATCPGGSIINVSAGYWRSNYTSSNLIECRISENCFGGYNQSCSAGYVCCDQGYNGPLCQACNNLLLYTRSHPNKCGLCESKIVVILTTFLFLIGIFAYYIMYSNLGITSQKAIMCGNPETIERSLAGSIYIRTVITYSQLITIVTTLILNLPPYFNEIIKPLIGFTGSPNQSIFFSSRCTLLVLLGLPNNSLYLGSVAITTTLPIISILCISLIRISRWKFKFTRSRVCKLGNNMMCILTTSQPSVVQILTQYLQCSQLPGNDPDQNHYIYSELDIQCYDSKYYQFLYAFVLPNLILWVIIFPALFFWIIFKKRHDLDDHALRLTMGVLLNGYKKHSYFWGLVIIALKLVIIGISTLLYDDPKTCGLTLFIVFYCYYYCVNKYQPYYSIKANQIEKIIQICFMLTLFFVVYAKNNESYFLTMVGVFIVIGANIIALTIIISSLFGIYKSQFMTVHQKINNYIQKSNIIGIEMK